MTSEPAPSSQSGGVPDLAALARIVARQRAEMDRLQELAATSAVVERAKGALMALTGCSPDHAHEELLQRAKNGSHTLIEECWLTLGALMPPLDGFDDAARPAGQTGPRAVPAEADDADDVDREDGEDGEDTAPVIRTVTAPPVGPGAALQAAGPDDHSEALGRIGKALVRVGSPQELAVCLLERLGPEAGADAVLLFKRLPEGGLELIGHAGVGGTLAAQWHRVPPLGGVAPLDALENREPRWLEDLPADRSRYLLMGDPPERWRSRAWLPVSTGQGADVALGVLRGRAGPFAPRTRAFLLAVARLCAGRLRAFDAPREHATPSVAEAVQAVFDVLPGTAILLTPLRSPSGEVEDYRIDAATPDSIDVLDRTGRELVGLRILECYPSVAGEPLWQGYLAALTTGEPYEGEPFAYQEMTAEVPQTVTYSVRAARLGDQLVVSWIRHDPSDRQEQRLADVQRLGNLGWANWNLLTHEALWSVQAYSVLGRDPARGPVALEHLPDLVLPEDAPAVSRAVTGLVRSGRPFDVPFRVRTALGVRHLRAVAEAVADQDGTPVEVHGFVQDLTAQRSAELALVESERAVLMQRGILQAERAMAARLQHALLPLPSKPVRLAGLRVDVAYVPAQSEIHVSGDWFSAIELPDHNALFVVGDVAGHGIGAVATMAQLRFTAKGMVSTGSSLTGALARLNMLLLHSRDSHGTATMVLARYEPEGRRLAWAQAGHPPPLLLRGGEAGFLDRPAGMLLGASAAPVYHAAECRLEPGDRLLLYTDGLVERPGEGIDAGLARLATAVLAQNTDGPGALESLLTSMLEGERRDDVCVLDIRVPTDSA
ncbi:SpoIIE family protein phosphatase [Streptomyces sp. NPDC020298]|uniref:SpoIIE family protein phosphatase n=1 Tax=unclassified Streptomyces TaxID=2593676 RepID=UPI00340DED67